MSPTVITYLPANSLGNADTQFLSALSAIIQIPRSGVGLLPSLVALNSVLRALDDRWPRPGVRQLIERVERLHCVLSGHEALPSHLRSTPGNNQIAPAFSALMNVATLRPRDSESTTLQQVIGAVFLHHICEGQPISNHRGEQLRSLIGWRTMRADHRVRWGKFVHRLDLDSQIVGNHAQQSESRTIRVLGAWLAEIIEAVRSCSVPSLSDHSPPNNGDQQEPSANDAESEGARSEYRSVDLEGEALPDGPLVMWAYMRSVRGTFASTAGLPHWDMLNAKELRRSTLRIALALQHEDGLIRRIAALATLSLAVGLPLRQLLRLSLVPNGDLWLDTELGCVTMNLDVLVPREEVSQIIRNNGWGPSPLVHLALPVSAVDVLRHLGGEAKNLGEHLFPGLSFDEIQARYADLLRPTSSDASRKAYAARFAYSLGGAICAVTADSIAAGYGAIDFRFLAPGELYYLCIHSTRLHSALETTYSWLGLGPVVPLPSDGYFGSPLAPRPEIYKSVVKQLADELACFDPSSCQQLSVGEVFEVFNRRSKIASTLFVLMTGDRGSMLERRTFSALFGHAELAMVFDKETNTSAERPIPVVEALRGLLTAYLADIRFMSDFAKRHGMNRLASRLAALADLRRPHASTFFLCESISGEYRLVPVKASAVAELLASFGVALNGGRHYLTSRLADAKFPAYLRRTLTGHGAKAGLTFHLASGVIPIDVFGELRTELEEELSSCQLPLIWPSLGRQDDLPRRVTLQAPKSGPLESNAISAYIRRDRRNLGRQSRRFTLVSVALYAHATHLREVLLTQSGSLSADAALLLSLILIDGLTSANCCHVVWDLLVTRQSITLKNSIWIEYVQPNGRGRVFSPLPPSVLFLDQVLEMPQRCNFLRAMAILSDWLRSMFPELIWSSNDQEVFAAVCNVGAYLPLFELPVWLNTAETPALWAASITLSSLARKAYEGPLVQSKLQTGERAVKRRSRHPSNLGLLLKHLNRIASSNWRFGESRSRKIRLARRIEVLRHAFAVYFPMTQAVMEYLLAESAIKPVHGEPLELSTLATYLSMLKLTLELWIHLHPLDLTEKDWIEIFEHLQRMAKSANAVFDPSPIRRFARYWLSQGCFVPKEIFGRGGNESDEPSKWSTASTFFWNHEWKRLRTCVLSGVTSGAIEESILNCYLLLLEEAPTRAGELNFLRLGDFDEEFSEIVITSSGFDHLKMGEKSRRTILIKSTTAQELSRLRRRLNRLSPAREYFFLEAAHPATDMAFISRVSQVSEALRTTTGDMAMRRHALRGRAECVILVPDVDRFVAGVLDGDSRASLTHLPATSGNKAWQDVVFAAFQAGHHTLTFISSYGVIWPLLSRQYRLSTLSDHWPGKALCEAGGLTWGHLRVVKHRAKKVGEGSLHTWERLLEPLNKQKLAPIAISIGQIPEANDVDLSSVDTPGFPVQEIAARLVWCAGLITAGAETQFAADLSQLAELKGAGKMIADISGWARRDTSISEDCLRLAAEQGLAIAMQISSVKDIRVLKDAASALEKTERVTPATEAVITRALEQVTLGLPRGWGISVLPEYEGLPKNSIPRIRAICPDLIIKQPSKSLDSRFRFSVTAVGASRISPRSQGVATKVLRLLILCAITLRERESHRESR